jgi:hypothetical protein
LVRFAKKRGHDGKVGGMSEESTEGNCGRLDRRKIMKALRYQYITLLIFKYNG